MNETPVQLLLKATLVLQAIFLLAGFILPFGFDHPSSIGLDFGDFLLLSGLYLFVFGVGIVAALVADRRGLAFDQFGFACAALLVLFVKDVFF